MDTSGFVRHLTVQPAYKDQIVHVEHIDARPPLRSEIEKPLNKRLEQCLDDNGLLPLYSHQAEAVNLAGSGKNVIVTTSSASGKTLCYNIPVLD